MIRNYTNYSSIRLKDRLYIKIYFKNYKFKTGYKINDYKSDWDENNKALTSSWIKNNKKAFAAIQSLQTKINALIDKARSNNENELDYVLRKLKEQKEESKKFRIAQTQLPSEAFEAYIEQIKKKNTNKSKSFKRFENYLMKLKWYEEKCKKSLTNIDIDYIKDYECP